MANSLPPPPIGEPPDSLAWQQWYIQLGNIFSTTGGTIPWSLIDTSGSDITDIINRAHNNLQSIQGGTTGEFFHLTSAQNTGLTGGNSTTLHHHQSLQAKSVAGGTDVTLTATEAKVTILEFSGVLTANINVIVPTSVWQWTVFNNTSGAFTLTIKTSGGTGIAIGQGKRAIVYCDGTNVVRATSDV